MTEFMVTLLLSCYLWHETKQLFRTYCPLFSFEIT